MTGKAQIHGDSIVFGPMAMTRMACPPPLDAVETSYAGALLAVRAFRLNGAELTLSDGKGAVLVVFRRAE